MKYLDWQLMNRKVKSKILPKLRFPEFIGADGWYETELGQCLIQHPDYGVNAPAVPYDTDLPTYLRITDISEEGRFLADQKMSVDEKKVTNDSYLEEGDIVLARTGASVGKSYKYRIEDGKLVFAGFLIRIRPDPRKLNSELLAQFLNTSHYWHWVNFTSTRSGQPGINGNEYSSMPLLLPSTLKEQQKIADCLSSLDDLIAAQSQKIEVLKELKKGLMRQLFPAKGQTVPRLRFKDFTEDWTMYKLSDIATFSSGGTPSKEVADYWNGDIPWISAASMYTTKISKSDSNITRKAIEDGARVARKGALLILVRGSMLFNRIPMGIATRDVAFNQDVKALDLNDIVENHFLLHQLGSKESQILNAVTETGIGAGKIDTGHLKEITIYIPSKREQQKITDCLSSLDDFITTQSEKLDSLKSHKKGLMQQLFPQEKTQ